MRFNHIKICLASASPRRSELLDQIGVQYEVCPTDIDERIGEKETSDAYVTRMATEKAARASQQLRNKNLPVLAADTIVVIDEKILGKPENQSEAVAMLQALRGRTHKVLTAVVLVYQNRQSIRLSRSDVRFSQFSDEEIDRYWESGEPRDKAGAYAIQGKAALFIESLEGSYSGVMGLPLYEVGQLLDELEI